MLWEFSCDSVEKNHSFLQGPKKNKSREDQILGEATGKAKPSNKIRWSNEKRRPWLVEC